MREEIFSRLSNKQAGQMREMCGNFELLDFELIKVTDEVPAVTKIEAKLIYKTMSENRKEKTKTFRLINEDREGDRALRGFSNSKWVIYSYYLDGLIKYKIQKKQSLILASLINQ